MKPLPKGLQHATVPRAEGSAAAAAARAAAATAAGLDTETLSPHTFWIHRDSHGAVILHYKELSTDSLWLPSKDSLMREICPEGIRIFSGQQESQLPPDPMTRLPDEAELYSLKRQKK